MGFLNREEPVPFGFLLEKSSYGRFPARFFSELYFPDGCPAGIIECLRKRMTGLTEERHTVKMNRDRAMEESLTMPPRSSGRQSHRGVTKRKFRSRVSLSGVILPNLISP